MDSVVVISQLLSSVCRKGLSLLFLLSVRANWYFSYFWSQGLVSGLRGVVKAAKKKKRFPFDFSGRKKKEICSKTYQPIEHVCHHPLQNENGPDAKGKGSRGSCSRSITLYFSVAIAGAGSCKASGCPFAVVMAAIHSAESVVFARPVLVLRRGIHITYPEGEFLPMAYCWPIIHSLVFLGGVPKNALCWYSTSILQQE